MVSRRIGGGVVGGVGLGGIGIGVGDRATVGESRRQQGEGAYRTASSGRGGESIAEKLYPTAEAYSRDG